MADENNKSQKRAVDDAGIRLAPAPIKNSGYHVMPSVVQDFIITPHIVVDEPEDDGQPKASTENDFQPKKQDISKRWKRRKRAKNMVVGLVMFVVTVAVVLPYILGTVGVWLDDFAFRYVPRDFSAINNIVRAFKLTASFGWKGAEVKAIWVNAVPDLILLLGIIFLASNLLKSLFAMIGSVKPINYTEGAVVYLFTVLAVFIAALVGAEKIGVSKIDFVQDFIHGYKTSELFSLVIFAVGYFVVSFICTRVDADKYGYMK